MTATWDELNAEVEILRAANERLNKTVEEMGKMLDHRGEGLEVHIYRDRDKMRIALPLGLAAKVIVNGQDRGFKPSTNTWDIEWSHDLDKVATFFRTFLEWYDKEGGQE